MKLLRLTQHDYDRIAASIRIGEAERAIAYMVLVQGMGEGEVSQTLSITRQRVNSAIATFSRKYAETGLRLGVVRAKTGVPHEMLAHVERQIEQYLK